MVAISLMFAHDCVCEEVQKRKTQIRVRKNFCESTCFALLCSTASSVIK